MKTVEEFWARVEKTETCWWFRRRDGDRFTKHPSVTWRGQKNLAHRIAWLLTHKRLPVGKQICHRCDNPPCVRPSHLFVGTDKDNRQDMANKDRSTHGERNSQARLTADDVREVRRLYSNRMMSQQEIADQFGVEQTTVSFIVRRVTWRRVS